MTLLHDIDAVRPATLAEALDLLQTSGAELRPMAGCTDVLVEAHFGKAMPRRFLDLTGLHAELGGLAYDDEGLHLGALCTYAQALRDPRLQREAPALWHAASVVGATQIQARGTFAGNVENASPAADAAPVLMALDAEVELVSMSGLRRVPMAQYYSGYRQTVRRADELIAALVVPQRSLGRPGQWYRKVGTRAYQAITKVGLAAHLTWQDGVVQEPRIVAVAMSATIKRCEHLEALVRGRRLEDLGDAELRAAQALDVQPIDDVRSTAAYRAEVFARLLRQALAATAAV